MRMVKKSFFYSNFFRVFAWFTAFTVIVFSTFGLHSAIKKHQQNNQDPTMNEENQSTYNNQGANVNMCGSKSLVVIGTLFTIVMYGRFLYDGSSVLNQALVHYTLPFLLVTLIIPIIICCQRKEIIVYLRSVIVSFF